jgi:hypothetical protein
MRHSVVAIIQGAITVLALTFACAQVSSPPPPSYRFLSGGAALDIPFEAVADGLIFVQAKVNGHAGWFILDNATQGFTIDRSYARQIGLQNSGTAAARGGGANLIEAGVIRDIRLSLPGLELIHRNLVAIELKALESSVGHEIDGIIGSRLFDDFVVEVDYERHRVSIFSAKESKPSAKGTAFPSRSTNMVFNSLEPQSLCLEPLLSVPAFNRRRGKYLRRHLQAIQRCASSSSSGNETIAGSWDQHGGNDHVKKTDERNRSPWVLIRSKNR